MGECPRVVAGRKEQCLVNKRAQAAVAVVLVSFGGLYMWRSHTPSPLPLADGELPTALAPTNDAVVATTAPRVDIVFALDTTGSMGGLIEGAKAKIWEI